MLRVYAVNALVFNALSCVHPRPCKARGHGHVAQPHGRSRTLHHRRPSDCELTAGVVNYHELTAGHKSTMNSQKTFKFLWLLTQGYSGLGRTIVGLATGPPRIVSEQALTED